jgi:hypothetical protein
MKAPARAVGGGDDPDALRLPNPDLSEFKINGKPDLRGIALKTRIFERCGRPID